MVIYPEKLQILEKSYEIDYLISPKMTSSVRIKGGKVLIKLSRYTMGFQRERIIRKFLKWAERRLAKFKEDAFIKPVYENGGRIVTHNKVYELNVRIVPGDHSRAVLKNDYVLEVKISDIFARLNPGKIKSKIQFLAEKLIMKDQTPYLEEILLELNQLYFQEELKSCRFKRTNSRFGSCSSKRNINIALRLLFAPREVFRYVCIHELSHLKEMNHSKRFWAHVEAAMPDYKESEKWLRENGFMLG